MGTTKHYFDAGGKLLDQSKALSMMGEVERRLPVLPGKAEIYTTRTAPKRMRRRRSCKRSGA